MVRLHDRFLEFGFDVIIEADLTGSEIVDVVTGLAKSTIWSSYASMALCILSHGGDGVIYGINDEPVRMNDLKYAFNHEQCPELSGKPKLFVIHACRGEKHMSLAKLKKRKKLKVKLTIDRPKTVAMTLAPIRDTLDVYSSLPQFVSYRSEKKGKLLAVNRCKMISNRSIGQVLSSFRSYARTWSRLAWTAETSTISFTMLERK
jgi:Caspase domain